MNPTESTFNGGKTLTTSILKGSKPQINSPLFFLIKQRFCNSFQKMHKVTKSDSGGIFFVSAGETLYVGRGLVDGKLCLGSRSILYLSCFTSLPYTFNTTVTL